MGVSFVNNHYKVEHANRFHWIMSSTQDSQQRLRIKG